MNTKSNYIDNSKYTIDNEQLLPKNNSIRDTIHSWIEYSELEKDIINNPLVQRMKWVSQLSAVYHVYSGANNTRFSHSLGVMFLAGKYMTHIFTNKAVVALCINHTPEHYIQLARIAGLLHDIGHGPFSHVFDDIVYKEIYHTDHGHDVARLKIIEHESLKPLIEKCGITTDEIVMVWSEKLQTSKYSTDVLENQLYKIISAIVQGPLGADRIDFTLRDGYNTGTSQIGTIVYQRIMSNTEVIVKKNQLLLTYNFKCIREIISALDSRLYLYHDVYFHKTVMAGVILIKEMLATNINELNLIEMTTDLNQFKKLTDIYILGKLSDDVWCEKYTFRILPKIVKEKMVYADDKYEEEDYINMWCDGELKNNQRLIKTRVISGISPKKFEQYNIKFKNGCEILSCSDALQEIKYTPPQPPYYLVRLYEIQ